MIMNIKDMFYIALCLIKQNITELTGIRSDTTSVLCFMGHHESKSDILIGVRTTQIKKREGQDVNIKLKF